MQRLANVTKIAKFNLPSICMQTLRLKEGIHQFRGSADERYITIIESIIFCQHDKNTFVIMDNSNPQCSILPG